MLQDVLSNTTSDSPMKDKFSEKAYRDAYVREQVRIGVPYQIRALRQERGWTQKELGERSGKPQNVISRLEDPNYGKLSLQSLMDMASAFDVALMVKFVPFSRFIREFSDLSPRALEAASFSEDQKTETSVPIGYNSLPGLPVSMLFGTMVANAYGNALIPYYTNWLEVQAIHADITARQETPQPKKLIVIPIKPKRAA